MTKITTLAELEAEADSPNHGTDVYDRIADMKAIIERLDEMDDVENSFNGLIFLVQKLKADLKGET
jgi:hypothetical protein